MIVTKIRTYKQSPDGQGKHLILEYLHIHVVFADKFLQGHRQNNLPINLYQPEI